MFLYVRAATDLASLRICAQGTKIFQYCTGPTGRGTYNFHLSCKHMHLSFKSVCIKEHKGVICNVTSSSNSSQSTRPSGRVLWEELLVLSIFHRNYEWTRGIFCPLGRQHTPESSLMRQLPDSRDQANDNIFQKMKQCSRIGLNI